jgi:hypothetical protein
VPVSALATYPGQQPRGVFQAISRVVASGSTIVTTGAQVSDGLVRQQFFTSTDGGATWHLAPMTGQDGSPAPLGYQATRLAAGPRGWVAVGIAGPQATWTSANGLSWTLAAHPRRHPATAGRPGPPASPSRPAFPLVTGIPAESPPEERRLPAAT